MGSDITKRCTGCRKFISIRDMFPNGDGTYTCVQCRKDDDPEFLYWT